MPQLDHPRWAEVAERCLACANCTLVCPTCFCTSVDDASDLDGAEAPRERSWDSCFTPASRRWPAANFRPRPKDRYRQWLTHKFATWWDQFGTSGCVGCGRCITWCPVGIDVREELARHRPGGCPAEPPGPGPRSSRCAARPRQDYATCAVTRVHAETADTTTLRLAGSTPSIRRPAGPVRDGRAAGLPARRDLDLAASWPDGLELTIRAAGPATTAITALQPGAETSASAARRHRLAGRRCVRQGCRRS